MLKTFADEAWREKLEYQYDYEDDYEPEGQ